MSKVTTLSPDSIAQFQSYMCERGRSANTVKAYTADLRMLLKFLGLDTLSHQYLESSTAKWLNETRASSAPRTTERRRTSLRAYSRWAKVKKSLLSDYSLPTKQQAAPHPLPEGIDGVERMCAATGSHRLAALFALQGMLGLRVGEALSVTRASLDTGQMMLTVRGKGDKERTLPVSQRAWRWLERAYNEAGTGTLVSMPDRTARDAITKAGAQLGFARHISSHDLRATAGTALYRKTQDIRMVQEFLGHSSITTTQVYIGISTDAMREGLEF